MSSGVGIVIVIVAVGIVFVIKWIMDNPINEESKPAPPPINPMILSAKCQNCGADAPAMIGDKAATHCPYCGASLTISVSQDLIEESIRIEQERQRHEMEMERLRRTERIDKSTDRTLLIALTPIVLAILGFIIMMLRTTNR